MHTLLHLTEQAENSINKCTHWWFSITQKERKAVGATPQVSHFAKNNYNDAELMVWIRPWGVGDQGHWDATALQPLQLDQHWSSRISGLRICTPTVTGKLLLLLLLSHFSRVWLCDPIDGSPPGSPVPGILQARTLEWVAISFSNAWKWKVKVKLLSRVRLLATPWTVAHQAPPSMGFSRQEYWSGLSLSSPDWEEKNLNIFMLRVLLSFPSFCTKRCSSKTQDISLEYVNAHKLNCSQKVINF